MSSMLARHREMLEDLFEMRGGFFLDFDNSAFKRYMMYIRLRVMSMNRQRQRSSDISYQTNQMSWLDVLFLICCTVEVII